ncbi:MAG: transcription termination factor Rho [Acidobacteria bacterium]|nr:transcription termination factor Rho [Acidobacteriota bacterium]
MLNSATMPQLLSVARDLEINAGSDYSRQGLIRQVLASLEQEIPAHGVLEVVRDGYGFLRGPETSYLPSDDDIYVSPALVREHGLRSGDTVHGTIRPPRSNGERYFAMESVELVNHQATGTAPADAFYGQTPKHPERRFVLEHAEGDISTRVLDMLCPIGKGQRALIVSPPRAGKTVLMQSIAHAITANHPEAILLVLLVDERPEEVTEMTKSVRGEVVASTFDEPATRHVKVADLVINKARRLAEAGNDVVILLDSITRLARAHNTVCPQSGRIMSGGVDAKALHKPKQFFGSARKLEGSGSLTIIATALVETGSRMDEVIFEEFKGTGNAEVVLDRRLAERRVWPAVDLQRSGTRKEELLLSPDDLHRIWLLRKILMPMDLEEGMGLLLQRLGEAPTNSEFLDSMKIVDE